MFPINQVKKIFLKNSFPPHFGHPNCLSTYLKFPKNKRCVLTPKQNLKQTLMFLILKKWLNKSSPKII